MTKNTGPLPTMADIEAMAELVQQAMRLLALTAQSKEAGAKARGDAAQAARYARLRDQFTNRPEHHLTLALHLLPSQPDDDQPFGTHSAMVALDVAEA